MKFSRVAHTMRHVFWRLWKLFKEKKIIIAINTWADPTNRLWKFVRYNTHCMPCVFSAWVDGLSRYRLSSNHTTLYSRRIIIIRKILSASISLEIRGLITVRVQTVANNYNIMNIWYLLLPKISPPDRTPSASDPPDPTPERWPTRGHRDPVVFV